MKQTLKIGVTVLLVAALAMSGIALAQTGGDDEALAGEGPVAKILEVLGPLVEDGTITQAQAEAVAETLAEAIPPRPPHRGARLVVRASAEFLGMEVEDLVAQMRDGATLTEIAGSQTDALIAALVADVADRLAEAVADGRLTLAEADEKLAEATERIITFVNEGPRHPERGPGPGGHGRGGPGHPGGFGGDAPFDDTGA